MAPLPQRDEAGFGLLRSVFLLAELVVGAAALILGAAFILTLMGANPDAQFAAWIYEQADKLMKPFENILPPFEVSEDMEINMSLLFAMAVYAIGASVLEGASRRA